MSWSNFKTKINVKEWIGNNKRNTALIIIAIILVPIMVWGLSSGTFLAFFNPQTDENVTTMTFYIRNDANQTAFDNNLTNGGVEAYVYLFAYNVSDPENFGYAELNALELEDFELNETIIENGDEFIPEDNKFYIGHCNASSGYGEYWFVPYLGTNIITLRELPEEVKIFGLSNNLNTEFANTTDIEWDISLLNINVGVVNKTDDNMGYKPYFDYTQMSNWSEVSKTKVYNVIVIQFNNTDFDNESVSFTGLYPEKILKSGNELQLYCDYTIFGNYQFTLNLDEDELGTLWNVESISWKKGLYEESLTTLATL